MGKVDTKSTINPTVVDQFDQWMRLGQDGAIGVE